MLLSSLVTPTGSLSSSTRVRARHAAGADQSMGARARHAGRVEELLTADPAPAPDAVNDAFWQACQGGQRRVPGHLLARGADLNWTPDHSTATPLDIAGSPARAGKRWSAGSVNAAPGPRKASVTGSAAANVSG